MTDKERLARKLLEALEWAEWEVYPNRPKISVRFEDLRKKDRKGLIKAAEHLLNSGDIAFITTKPDA